MIVWDYSAPEPLAIHAALELSATGTNDLPISVAEAKRYSRLTDNSEDALIEGLIRAAWKVYEEHCDDRCLLRKTWVLYLDRFPIGELRLPKPPLSSVSSIVYVATDGTSTTWSSSEYLVDAKSEPARITPVFGGLWPTARAQANAVTITFLAGAAAASAVDESDKLAVKMLVDHWAHNRGVAAERELKALPMAYQSLVMARKTGGYP